MANSLQLWISAESARLLAGSSSQVSAPRQTFFSGDNIDLELHLVEGVGVARSPYEVAFPAGSTVRVAIGTVATAPTSGQWRLSVSSTETTDLAYNATPAAVQSALNAIPAVSTAGGVSVSALGTGYSITWNTVGTKPTIVAGTDTLIPASFESVLILQAGSATDREIVFVELRQSPLAYTDTFSPVGSPVVTATTVSAWNGTNKVSRIKIAPAPRSGTYTVTVGTSSIAVSPSASSNDILAAFAAVGATSVTTVNPVGVLEYDIILSQNLTVSVDGSGLIASPGIKGTLGLSTAELIAYLGGSASRAATLEISITSAGRQETVVQVACTVANAVISSGAIEPVSAGTILTESVADARYIRRDAAQSPTSADLDVIWPNLGVTADGSDVAAAISGANAPASGNVFATMADIPPAFDQSLNISDNVTFNSAVIGSGALDFISIGGGSITFPDSTTQSTAAVFFDQALNSTDTVNFAGAVIDGLTVGTSIQAVPLIDFCGQINFADSTTQTTAAVFYDQSLNTTDSPSFEGLSATGGNVVFDDISSTYQFKWDATGGVAGVYGGATPIVTLNNAFGIELHAPGGTPSVIKYSDATTQESAPVYSAGTVIHSGGGGHIDALDYPDEIRIVIGGVTYAMPARIV